MASTLPFEARTFLPPLLAATGVRPGHSGAESYNAGPGVGSSTQSEGPHGQRPVQFDLASAAQTASHSLRQKLSRVVTLATHGSQVEGFTGTSEVPLQTSNPVPQAETAPLVF